jgi:hypothetical protein
MTDRGDARSPSPIALVALGGLIGLEGLAAARIGYPAFGFQSAAVALASGMIVAVSGLVAWHRAPASRTGPLLVAAGAASFIGAFGQVGWDVAADVAARLTWLHVAILGHAVLTQPDGRSAGRWVGALVAGLYVLALVTPAADPLPLAVGLVIAIVLRRLLGGADRRRGSADLAGLVIAAGLAAGPLLQSLVPTLPLNTMAPRFAAVAAAAFMLAADAIRLAPARSRVADIVLRLDPTAPTSIASELRRATGDPTLEVGFPLTSGDGYVDVAGRPVTPPPPGSSRVASWIGRDGVVTALVVHDRRLETDAALAAAASRAMELATANARLQAELRTQVADVRLSRRRLVEAGDEERRAWDNRLAAGLLPGLDDLDQRLKAIGTGSRPPVDEAIGQARNGLADVRFELVGLAEGLRPRTIEALGLGGALAQLVARSPIPVALAADDLPAVSPPIGSTIYYVCSEALANVAKHARASQVAVRVTADAGRLVATVADDGVGGADPDAGTGLRGIRDRVDALGGTFLVESRSASGTRVRAELPVATA